MSSRRADKGVPRALTVVADDAATAAARYLLDVIEQDNSLPPPSGVLIDLTIGGTRCLVTRVTDDAAHSPPPDIHALSPREREIARMVGQGYTNKEIARVLEISAWTVSTHLRRIFVKLNVTTRAAMVAQLLNGLTPASVEVRREEFSAPAVDATG